MADGSPTAAEVDALRRERDLYRRVLELGSQRELRPFVIDALALLCEAAGAHQGYLELAHGEHEPLRWHAAHGFSDSQVERVRSEMSGGIIAQAIATGETVVTQSAISDDDASRARSPTPPSSWWRPSRAISLPMPIV